MLKEIQKSKYLYDGLLIKLYQIFPDNFDKDNLLPIQKEFLILLVGFVPGLDGIQTLVRYEIAKLKIDETDYLKVAKDNLNTAGEYQESVMRMQAKSRGITFDEFLQLEADRLKKKAIKDLNKEYDVEDEKEKKSTRDQVLEKYEQFSKKLENSRRKNIESLLNPDFLKEGKDGKAGN